MTNSSEDNTRHVLSKSIANARDQRTRDRHSQLPVRNGRQLPVNTPSEGRQLPVTTRSKGRQLPVRPPLKAVSYL